MGAVAKAQYATSDIVSILKSNGADVKFMIHPVAGRLPGQLNVLLAEAGVDYDDMLEMDDHNDDADWSDVDLVVVAGANDTVNPLAETEPRCELYGMPVVRAWEAKEGHAEALPGHRLRRRAQPPHVQREHRDAPGRREVQPRGPAQRACQDAPVRVRGQALHSTAAAAHDPKRHDSSVS